MRRRGVDAKINAYKCALEAIAGLPSLPLENNAHGFCRH